MVPPCVYLLPPLQNPIFLALSSLGLRHFEGSAYWKVESGALAFKSCPSPRDLPSFLHHNCLRWGL